ncbi:DnaJ domain-containing protein [Aestuariibacter halophilus]|uniref:DnaJ domain-containing protein n=1 Tax=Fluctibacter halophilus TaxID=226011 RepID=A0ABS8G3U0_9ALTE|nr:DNA-J related domain-containing protein [Aestuariibacter halophilus]MCC2615193.1 DnaJ domain-containing protein [Aestuariibacter halophilus]
MTALATLTRYLEGILLSEPDGISEYALIRRLQQAPYQCIPNNALHSQDAMFHCHFTLFHALYALDARWQAQGLGQLDIIATCIRVLEPGQTLPDDPSRAKMRAYYLDISNLDAMDSDSLDELLRRFWSGIAAPPVAHSAEDIARARQLLKVSQPYTARQLKQCYRQRMHQCHPDKGGCVEEAQRLQWAYQVLLTEC